MYIYTNIPVYTYIDKINIHIYHMFEDTNAKYFEYEISIY